MSYLVLARKYRPATFDEIVGQEHVTRTLKNGIAKGKVHHAFLFTGTRGVGKTTTARVLAKALCCQSSDGPTAEPCGSCVSCLAITAGNSVDVSEIDGASNNSVNDIRDLRDNVQYRPQQARFKIYIIDEVHMLSTAAFNALLKTLEEPPAHVKFIFATTEVHKIPQTILSRCQRYDFKAVPVVELAAHLKKLLDAEAIPADENALMMMARLARGSVRDSLSLMDRVIAYAGDKVGVEDVRVVLGLADAAIFARLTQALVERNADEIFRVVGDLVDYGHDLRQFGGDFLEYLRDLTLAAASPSSLKSLSRTDGELSEMARIVTGAELGEWIAWFDLMVEGQERIARSEQSRYMLELTLAKMIQVGKFKPIDDLLAGVRKIIKDGVPQAAPGSGPAPARGRTRSENVVSIESRRAPEPAPAAPAPKSAPATRSAAQASVAADTQNEPDPEAEVLPPVENWDELVERVKNISRILWTSLRRVGGSMSGNLVRIECERDSLTWKQVGEASAVQNLTQTFSRICERPITVSVIAVDPGGSTISSIEDNQRKIRMIAMSEAMEKGKRDPLVMMLRSVFEGGEVTVKPLEKVEKGS
jgi:DNA polymerase-3 subunit gamma/tau